MHEGKTKMLAKVWKEPGVDQIDTLKAGVTVRGEAPADGYALLSSPVRGYTKVIWLDNYHMIIVAPPPEPDDDPDWLEAHWLSGRMERYFPE